MDYLPFPRFSSEKPTIWFAQIESVFTLNGIISDSDKYDYVVAHIPLDYSSLVEDILLNPPHEIRYDHIKYEFIKRMSIYRLKKEELGSDTPSEYLQRLRNLSDQRVPMEVILNIWLKNLPQPVREVVSLETSGHVEIIGPMADKVMALLPPASPQRNMLPSSSEQFDVIQQRMDELAKQVHMVQLMLHGEKQPPTKQERAVAIPGGSHDASYDSKRASHSYENYVVCYYHNLLGNRAVACIAPCQYNLLATRYRF